MRLHWIAGVLGAGMLWLLAFVPVFAAGYADLVQLIGASRYDEAREAARALSPDPLQQRQNLRFVDALILEHQGKFAEAAAVLRELLDESPNLIRVRFELAQVLFRAGDTDAAGYQFQLLAVSTDVASERALYERYLAAIRSQRPWTFSASFGLLPSPNINGGSTAGSVMVGGLPFTPANPAQSGIGVGGGISGSYTFRLTENWDVTVGSLDNLRLYADHDLDSLTAGGFVDFGYRDGPLRLGAGVAVDRQYFGWEGYRWGIGPEGSAAYDFGRTGLVTATGSVRQLFFDSQSDQQTESRAALQYDYAFTSSAGISLGLGVVRLQSAEDYDSYRGIEPSVRLYADLPFGIIGDVGAAYEMRAYDGPVPLAGVARDDRTLSLSAGATFRALAFAGVAPRLEYRFQQTDSAFDLYDTASQSLGVYLTKQF